MKAKMAHRIGLVVSLAILTAGAACGDGVTQPATIDFSGTWIGVSRVLSCEGSAEGCARYHVGNERYLSFRLTQNGDDVTGNLSPTPGGPLALPAVFWISGRLTSGRLPFQPMDVPGASGGLTSYSGEVTLEDSSRTQMRGRMIEVGSHFGEPQTIVWEVRTGRVP